MYLISKQIYLDNISKCCNNIIIINSKPEGKIKKLITSVKLNKLAESDNLYSCCNKNLCINAFMSIKKCGELMCYNEYPDLFFLNFFSI